MPPGEVLYPLLALILFAVVGTIIANRHRD